MATIKSMGNQCSFFDLQREIERLTEERDVYLDDCSAVRHKLRQEIEEKFELQKQVDELTEERENMEREIFSLENLRHQEQTENERLWASIERVKEQSVKDTAKEIWNELYKKHTEVYNQYVFKKDSDYDDLETNAIINFSDSLYFEITKYFKEKYGVEVE